MLMNSDRLNVTATLALVFALAMVGLFIGGSSVLGQCPNKIPFETGCPVGPFPNCPAAAGNPPTCTGTQTQVQDGLFDCIFIVNSLGNCVNGKSDSQTFCTKTYACMMEPGTDPPECVADATRLTGSTNQLQKVRVKCGFGG